MKSNMIPQLNKSTEIVRVDVLNPLAIASRSAINIHRFMLGISNADLYSSYQVASLATEYAYSADLITGIEHKVKITTPTGSTVEACFYVSLYDDKGDEAFSSNEKAARYLSNQFINRMKEITGTVRLSKKALAKQRRNELNQSAPSVCDLLSAIN